MKNYWSLGNSYTMTLDEPRRKTTRLSKRNLRRLYRHYLFSYTFETLPIKKEA